MVIRSIADIKNSYLFIVGDGPESEKLKRQVEDLNITDRVYFTGSLSRSRLLYLLSRSNCFVLNSKYEGLSHIILEAMAAGCPVIASNCGGNPEIIKHKENGFLIDPDNKDALKRYLIELKADPRLGAVLKKNGENTISENFHPEIKYQETLGVLLE
jgi:glycogen(starch) synthase